MEKGGKPCSRDRKTGDVAMVVPGSHQANLAVFGCNNPRLQGPSATPYRTVCRPITATWVAPCLPGTGRLLLAGAAR